MSSQSNALRHQSYEEELMPQLQSYLRTVGLMQMHVLNRTKPAAARERRADEARKSDG